MFFRKIAVSLLPLLVCVSLYAIPTRRTDFSITQPDGTSFKADLTGDEYYRLLTTVDGCAIIQDGDGFYCYAYYDPQGGKFSSGYQVGKGSVPARVISQSRDIPYEILRRNALFKRQKAAMSQSLRPNLIRRLNALHPMTKSGATVAKHCLVIPVQFTDLKFTYTKSNFDNLINGSGNSALKYLNDQFNGQYSFTFTIADYVTASHGYAYYGKNNSDGEDSNVAELVSEACQLADAQGVDFSQYDDDNDGQVDNVFIFYAGGDEADGDGENYIWAHQWYLKDGAGINLTLDGKIINNYACSSELMKTDTGHKFTAIGTFCHEYSHTLGLMDMYDTDDKGSGGTAECMWYSLCLMDAGNYNNDGATPPYYTALDRYNLGITEPKPLTVGTHTLTPVNLNGDCYILESGVKGEYYLFECRKASGWDAYIGGSGLLIYHVDKSDRAAGYSDALKTVETASDRWINNEVNCRPDHQCADIVEALPTANSVKQVFFPYYTHSSFTGKTSPSFTFWNNDTSSLIISNITRDGDNITFNVAGKEDDTPQTVGMVTTEIFQDGAIFQWTSQDPTYEGVSYIKISKSGGTSEEIPVIPYEAGKYAYVARSLSPKTAYQVQLYFKSSGGTIGTINTNANFTTRTIAATAYPFIYLNNVSRNQDGSFPSGAMLPLWIYNATTATSISWTYRNQDITAGGNGYFTLTESGLLKATVTYADGSKDVITKMITVK